MGLVEDPGAAPELPQPVKEKKKKAGKKAGSVQRESWATGVEWISDTGFPWCEGASCFFFV